MLKKFKVLFIPFLITSAFGQEKLSLSAEEQRIFEQIKGSDYRFKDIELKNDNSPVVTPNKKLGNNFNDFLDISRDDNHIVGLKMSVNDVAKIKLCYKAPVMIEFGDSIRSSLRRVETSNKKIVGAKILQDKKSLLIALSEPIEKLTPDMNAQWEETIWVERAEDDQDYVFKIFAESCPKSGDMPYPSKIRIEEREGVFRKEDHKMLASDYIVHLTKNTPRKSDRNTVNVNGMELVPNSTWQSFSVSLGFPNEPDNIKKIGEKFYFKRPKIIILDSLKQFEIRSEAYFSEFASQKEVNMRGYPVARFTLAMEITKKYIYERKYVYAIILFDNYHQLVKIPVYDFYKKEEIKNYGGAK